MRVHGRRDANHARIVKNLRSYGVRVLDLANVGQGAPDLLLGFRGRMYLVEIKNPKQWPSARRLTAQQKLFHGAWQHYATVCKSEEEVLQLIGLHPVRAAGGAA